MISQKFLSLDASRLSAFIADCESSDFNDLLDCVASPSDLWLLANMMRSGSSEP